MFTHKIKFDDITNLEVYIWAPDEEINTKLAGILFIVFDIILIILAIKKIKNEMRHKSNGKT